MDDPSLLTEFNNHRKNVRDLEDNIMKTRRKLNENLLRIKRAEAAISEIEASPPANTYTQAGQGFMRVAPDELTKFLAANIESEKKQRVQLVELEAKFVERLKSKKTELESLEKRIRAAAATTTAAK